MTDSRVIKQFIADDFYFLLLSIDEYSLFELNRYHKVHSEHPVASVKIHHQHKNPSIYCKTSENRENLYTRRQVKQSEASCE